VLQEYFDQFKKKVAEKPGVWCRSIVIDLALEELEGLVLTGEEFNELFKDIKFYKFTRSDERSYDHQYVPGLNIDKKKFNSLCTCCEGGLYFAMAPNMRSYFTGHAHLRMVTVPNDPKVWTKIERLKFKSTQLILHDVKIIVPSDESMEGELLRCIDGGRVREWMAEHPDLVVQ